MVEKRGEFAVRGGIVDVFPPTAEHPVRVEFWGDEVTELRAFAVADQRSTDPVDELDAPAVPGAAAHRRGPRAGRRARPHPREQPAAARAAGAPGRGHPAEGMESLIPALVGGRAGAAHRPAARRRARARRRPGADPHPQRRPGAHRPGVPGGVLDGRGHGRRRPDRPRRVGLPRPRRRRWSTPRATGRPVVTLSPLLLRPRRRARRRAPTRSTAYRGDIDRALVDLRAHVATGGAAVLVVAGHGTAQRAVERLARGRGARRARRTSCRTRRRPAWSRSPAGGSSRFGFTGGRSSCSPRPT